MLNVILQILHAAALYVPLLATHVSVRQRRPKLLGRTVATQAKLLRSTTITIAMSQFPTDSKRTSNLQVSSLCQSVQTHVTTLLIHWHLFAICSLLIVIHTYNSCHNGLEVELQSSL